MDDTRLGWVWKRRRPQDHARPLGAVLEGLAGSIWFKQQRHLGRIVRALEEIVPAGLAAHLAVDGFRRNTLHLLVDSAAHRYFLEGQKEELLAALNRQVSGVFIRELRLSVGKAAEVGRPADRGGPPGTPE